MKGLELSKKYFLEFGLPMLKARFPEYTDRIAAGLVGHGSECFGFDDDISRDHDFGAGFCLWITREDEREFGFRLFRAYNSLPQEFEGVKIREKSALGGGFKGVHTIEDFYSRYTGTEGAPRDNLAWLRIPSHYLAEATNGEVFCDPLGKFSAIRNEILNGMPDCVLYKKIASKAILMAQAGQYNYPRCLAHGDTAAATLALTRFAEHAAQMIYLLNGRHAPYYKWLLRGAETLPTMGERVADIRRLLTDTAAPKAEIIEGLCSAVIDELVLRGLSHRQGDYLEPYAFTVNERIKDSTLRNMHIIQE